MRVSVNLMIRSIDKIDDVKMEFSTQITFRQVQQHCLPEDWVFLG